MKTLLSLLLVFASLASSSQTKLEEDTIYSTSGFKVYKGQELYIGTGSTDDGDFKFIRRNSTGLGTMLMQTGDNRYDKSELSLPRNMAGHKGRVVKLVRRGTKKMGYTYEALINFSAGRYEIDIDNAIASGELKVPDEFKPKSNKEAVVIQQQLSAADELKKMKELLDAGVLTQAEYDTQKAKILSRN